MIHSAARIGFGLALLASVWFVFYDFIHSDSIEFRADRSYLSMLDGKADRPYAYRMLLPAIARAVLAALPAPLKEAATRRLAATEFVVQEFHLLHWPLERAVEMTVGCLLILAALLGFAIALGYLCRGVYETPDPYVRTIQLLALWGIPPLFRYLNYVYDFPTLFLFTLGLALLVRRRWAPFMGVYALACLNKETTILLTVVYVLHFLNQPDLSRQQFARLVGAQLAIYVTLKLLLAYLYRNNGGTAVEFHLDHNIELFTRGMDLPTAVAWLGLALLVLAQWDQKPPFLRRALMILAPLLALTFFLGFMDELRDYYEAYPAAILLMAFSMARIMGIPLSVRPAAEDGVSA